MNRAEQQQFYADTAAALSQRDRIAQLEAQNKRLVEALTDLYSAYTHNKSPRMQMEAWDKCKAALAGASHV